MANPCNLCIVKAMCEEPCQEFEDYINDTIINTMPPGHIGVCVDILSRKLKRFTKGELISTTVAIEQPDYHINTYMLVLDDGNITKIVRGYSVWEVT